ncbi:cytochrome P450 [Vogesella sp. DC21W]|uniref:Cytochrome P450 n=1 Tax=Vogesella aquatica TaxID=2984206 RepID=A0ABT5J1Q4_9NEIS|nr:cytochrome P450 [Vogesella aquatica]MDC7718782.1 cytochrome P450 [Vogesella aquatica]
MTQHVSPLSAAHQPCPAAWYSAAAAARPFYFDAELAVWVAASAATVAAVLHSPLCGVRPAGQPLPAALQGRALGALFSRLLRQRDGPAHLAGKAALLQALAALSHVELDGAAHSAIAACQPLLRQGSAAAVDAMCLQLPLHLVATLLGMPAQAGAAARAQLGSLLAGLATTASEAQIAAAETALAALLAITRPPPPVATPLWRALAAAWPDAEWRAANLLALLQQTHDASAALLANALYRLAQAPRLRRQLRVAPRGLPAFIAESQRLDAAVQHSWRFVQQDGELCGQPVTAGQRVLVLLAAANLDPACHAEPLAFRLQRGRREHGFGAGAHRCPGSRIALAACHALLQHCLRRRMPWRQLAASQQFHPPANVRWRHFDALEKGDTA